MEELQQDLEDLHHRVAALSQQVESYQLVPVGQAPVPVHHDGNGQRRTLAKCTVRFNGKDSARVTTFIRQVEDFRSAEAITEEASLRSVALLLEGRALD